MERMTASFAAESVCPFGMDDDRIVFRDQAALDEYVHGALDDCDAQALRRNAKHGQIVHAAQAQAWDEGVRHAESCAGGLTCDPRTANPYRVLPPGQGRTKEPTP